MDILEVQYGIIVHQVNLQGKMGAGLAKQVKETYPLNYEKYLEDYHVRVLGDVLVVTVKKNLHIANLYGQESVGAGLQTDYTAIATGLDLIAHWSEHAQLPVYIPEKMGCGLGGGNWNAIKAIIKDTIPYAWIVSLERSTPYRL